MARSVRIVVYVVAFVVFAHICDAFQLRFMAPNAVATHRLGVFRLVVTDFPIRHCGEAKVTVRGHGIENTSQIIVSCHPSYLIFKADPLETTGSYDVIVTAARQTAVFANAFTVVGPLRPIESVSPNVVILQSLMSAERITLQLHREIFPPSAATSEYGAEIAFTRPGVRVACSDTVFADVPRQAGLVSVTCVPAFPPVSAWGPTGTTFLLATEVRVTADAGGAVHTLAASITALKPVTIERVEPALVVYAEAQKPQPLTLVTPMGAYDGTAPLCARITAPSDGGAGGGGIGSRDGGGFTIDDAATVLAPDFISVHYTSAGVPPGPATLWVGVLNAAGACIHAHAFPSAVTVTAGAPPELQHIFAVYPPTYDPEALAAGAMTAVYVEGGVPAAATLALGGHKAQILYANGRGCGAKHTTAQAAGAVLLGVLITDSQTGAVLAYAPALFQLQARQPTYVISASPPVLFSPADTASRAAESLAAGGAVGTGPAEPSAYQIVFHGTKLSLAQSVVAWAGGRLTSGALYTTAETAGRYSCTISFSFSALALEEAGGVIVVDVYSSIEPDTAARARSGRDAAAESHLLFSYEFPLMDTRLLSVTPSSVHCLSGGPCEVDVTAMLPGALPFPLVLAVGNPVLVHGATTLLPDGRVTTERVMFGTAAAGSVPLFLDLDPAFSAAAAVSGSSAGGPADPPNDAAVQLSMDVLFFSEAPAIVEAIPREAVVAQAIYDVIFRTSSLLGANDDSFSVRVGPYPATVASRGTYYVRVHLVNEPPLVPQVCNVTISYRGEVVFTQAGAFSLRATDPKQELPIASSITPLWLIARSDPERYTLTGSGLSQVARVNVSAAGGVWVLASQVTAYADGKTLQFVVALTETGTYTVSVLYRQYWLPLAEFVAASPPALSAISPNNTIPMDPPSTSAAWFRQGAGRRAVAAEPDPPRKSVLSTLTVTLSSPTALWWLPLEFLAVFESDGTEATAIGIKFEPLSNLSARLIIIERGIITPGTYRICFRSLLKEQVSSVTQEIPGAVAILAFDFAAYVPFIISASPTTFHVATDRNDPVFRNTVFGLKNSIGNLPDPEFLAAQIGDRPAAVVYVNSNCLVLRHPISDKEPQYDWVTLLLLDTRTGRSVAAVDPAAYTRVYGLLDDPVRPLGLQNPRVYAPGDAPIEVVVVSESGFGSGVVGYIGMAQCLETRTTGTTMTCVVDQTLVRTDIFPFQFEVMIQDRDGTQQIVGAGEFVPRITVLGSAVTELERDAVRVSVSFECANDLSKLPFAPHLPGVAAVFSDITITSNALQFVARRTGGLRTAAVELYDFAAAPNPASADPFIVFPTVVVAFRGTGWPVWAIVLLAVLGVVSAFGGAACIAKRCMRRGESDDYDDDEDEDGEDDYDDETAVSGTSEYHLMAESGQSAA